MEGAYFLKNGTLESFSEQQFVDCSHEGGNDGCNGGLMDNAFMYAENHMMETEAAYPYVGIRHGRTCKAQGGIVEVQSYSDVAVNDPAAL